jgi:hypothetical protein
MSKNIVIFSDGIGQPGGERFDEVRANIYEAVLCPPSPRGLFHPGLVRQRRSTGNDNRWRATDRSITVLATWYTIDTLFPHDPNDPLKASLQEWRHTAENIRAAARQTDAEEVHAS